MSDASLHLKAGFAVAYSACEFVVEALDDVDNLLWHPIGLKDALQTLSVHAVKSLLKVYKVDAKLSLPLYALLCDVRKVKICSVHLFPFLRPCLLSSQLLVHCVSYSLDDDLGQDLAGYR